MKVTLHKLFVCTAFIFSAVLCSPAMVSAQKQLGIKTIVIDPGHGGKDPGCVSGNLYEKDIALAVGLQLGDMIKKNLKDVKVVYTRDKDVAVGLYERSNLANKVGADLFISIHVNSIDPKKTPPSGMETFVMGAHKSDQNLEVAMRENSVIVYEDNYLEKYQGYDNSPESFVIFSIMQYANTEQSIALAQTVQSHYSKSRLLPDRGAKQAGYLVLWNTSMPSILTEIGFLPNANDRKLMTSKDGQKKIATALFNAVSEYKSKVENNSNPIIIDAEPAYGNGTVFAAEPMSQPTVPAQATPAQTAPVQTAPAKPQTTWPNPTQTTSSNAAQTTQTQTAPAPQAASQPAGSSTASSGQTSRWVFSSDKIVYRVQIYSVPRRLSGDSRELKPFKGNVTERKIGGNYKYYVGSAETYEKALELQKEVRKTVKDAFLVAFDGEQQITVSEARRQTK